MRKLALAALIAVLGLSVSNCKSSNSSQSLFVSTSVDEELMKELAKSFEDETHQKVEFVRLSTGEAAARIEAEKNNPQAAIWLGGPAGGHAEVKAKGLTTPYLPTTATKIPAKFRDPQNFWTGLYVGVLALAVNPDQITKRNLKNPEVWADLLDAKWKGNIQMPNPGTSGTSYNFMTTMITKMGEPGAFDYMKSLHKNISQYTRSGQAPIKNVALGESVVGIGYAQDILRLIYATKAPLQIIYPKDGTGYEVAAISMIKGSKQEELAKKFFDWMYSAKASQVIANQYIEPLLKENITVKKESLMPTDLKLIDTNIDWAGKNKTRLIETWNEKINS
jgi:iron(III) transport system substrate-binding protein